MKPTCDHPSYCKDDYRSYYLGQNHHLEYPGHRNNKGYWPNGWMQIRHQWDGTCAYTAGHGGANALCNIPANTHSWRNIYSGGAMNEGGATSFVCAVPASFIQKLGAKNGVPSRTYEFQTVSVEQRGGSWIHLSLEECSNIGMRPICDHPSYCKNDYRALYIGQTWHIAYPPHRNNMGLFPEGWNLIRNRWNKLCSYTGNHGGGKFLCNIPRNTHAWRHPDDDANTIMCGKIAPFEAALGPKNGVPGRSYEFQMVTYNKWIAWSINSAMVESCKEIGMKPVCDHPSYCKNDPRSIYIGQSHHIAYKPHRNNRNYFPRGWEEIKDNWNGICSYTAHHGHNGHRALCNINFNSHSWQSLHWGANTWMCARIKGFTKVLGKRKNVPRRRYEFRIVESQLGGMRFDKAMLAECSAIGMKPICDHPNYCRNNPESLYLGQDHHLAYKPHRNAKQHWPSGWNDIKDQWNGLCAYTVNHGTGGLCNIPLNTHSWQKISSFANRFMCGRVAPFQAWLDAGESSLGERRYSFRVVSTGQRGGKFGDMMRRECRKLGMKPVCDHPKYCKNDRNALYIGQKHHISHPKQRNDDSGFPKGWSFIKDNFHGTCLYTGGHGGGKALCNYPFNTHSWRNLDDTFNTFVCGKVLRFKKKLGSKNKVPENEYVFEMVKVGETAYGKRFSQVMIDSCQKRGMKPICDHPNYCRSDSKALYLGQTHHLTYWPHRKNDAFWPSGWKSIRSNWDGMCAYTAHHGTGALCNIPKNTHSWQNPSDIANTFMCGRIASLKVELGSKNGVQAQRYEFRVVRTDVRSGKFSDVMLTECKSLGMKPVCDHRSYCRNDKNSIYLGQDHHLAHPGNRNNLNFFPSGWKKVKHLWDGLCTYTSNRGAPGTTLCNIPSNTHSWQKLSDKANGFVCARIAPEEDDGKATEAACQLVKGFRVTPQAGHTKKSQKKSWRRCERWCERNANMENACQYENGNCMLMKPEADDGKFEDDYSGYGCLFTRYADLSTWTKHSSGIKISKDKFSATLPKGRQLESKRDLARNLIVSAKIKASSCAGMSFFNTKKSKSSGLTLMTGEGGDKAKAMPTGKSLNGIKRNRWNEVRIASYFWGTTEYYVNGKLVDRSDKSKDSKKGSVMFLADCSNIEVKNVKMWEVCGGKGVKEGNKDEHAKGKAKHAKINEALNTCTRKHNSLKIDVINQQKTERVNNGQGNHWCRNRDNMKGERDNMKSQKDKTGNERDGANKEQQQMEAEREKAKENKSTMSREMDSGKRLLESTKREHQKNARGCLDKSKALESKNKAEYAKEEDRRKREESKLKDDTKAMNSKWRAKMSRGQKVKGREEMDRTKLKSESKKLDSKTRECNEMIRNAETLWTKKTEDLEDKKTKEGKGVDEASNKLSKEFKKKILDTNELTRTKIAECKKREKEDIGVCEKEKEDQNSRWTTKYRKLEEYWGAEMLKEKTEGGLKTQKRYKKELARCKAMGVKEKSECETKHKQCKLEGKGYKTRMIGHQRLEKIAIKMKKEADRNFAQVKTKYDAKLEKYQTCVRETEELDAKHNAGHTKMQAELEGHLIQHAACMKRHDQSLKLVNNYKKMFNMIRTSVTRLRDQSKSEFERARKLQAELMAYERKCGKLENDWRSKFDKVEHAALVAERKQKDAEDDYTKVDNQLKSLDKRYKFLQKAKGEDEKTWRLRITRQKQENRRAKKLEEKKIKDRQKRWEIEKKKLVKKEDETHEEYDARVKKTHNNFHDKEKEFEGKWKAIVHKISRKNGESTKEFRKRVKRAYKKYRQVSDYVGRFKQAKKMHQDDVALYAKQFKEQTEKAGTTLKDYSSQLKRWKSKADNEKARLVDAVRRQNRDLREAKKAKLKAERARKLLEEAKKDGEDENKEKIKKSLKLKEDATDFDDKWKSKVEKNKEHLREKEKKANEYWSKRFDIEKKAAMGATSDKITDDLRGVLGKRFENQIKELEHKTKGIEKDEAHKVSGWKKRIKTLTTKETNHVKELENGNLRAYRQVAKEKKLQKEQDQLINDLHMTCNDHEGKANVADDFEADNSRISATIRKRENEMEEVRDEFKNERNAFRERQKKAKQEIKDLSMVAAHLQEKLEQIQKLSSVEAHVSKGSPPATIQHPAPLADDAPFYTQSQ